MWTAVLGVGGALLGVVVALWFRYKLAKSEGDVAVQRARVLALTLQRDQLSDAYEKTLSKLSFEIGEHQIELIRRDKELTVHVKRERELNELLNKYKNDPELAVSRLGQLFTNTGG